MVNYLEIIRLKSIERERKLTEEEHEKLYECLRELSQFKYENCLD